MSDDIFETAKAVGGVLVAVLFLAVILSSIFSAGGFGSIFVEETFEPSTSDPYEVHNFEEAGDIDVLATTERAVELEGSENSYVDSPGSVDPNTTWSVAATAWLDEDAPADSWMDVVATDNGNVALQYANGSWVGYYDEPGTANDSSVSIDATDPTSQTSLVLRWDGTELSLTDGDQNATSTLDNTTESREVSWGWDGRLDEIRLLNATLTDAQATTYVDDPTRPLDPDAHTARLMFDEGEGTTTEVYYHSDDAQLVNASWADGVADPGLEAGVDYEFDDSGNSLTITAVSGGLLEDAPVAYLVASDQGNVWAQAAVRIVGIATSALGLLVVGALALVGAYLHRELNGFGGGGR